MPKSSYIHSKSNRKKLKNSIQDKKKIKMSEDILSEEKRKELDMYYKKLPMPSCKECGKIDHVIPSVRGIVSRDVQLYAQEGHVKLSGGIKCPRAWCKKCGVFMN